MTAKNVRRKIDHSAEEKARDKAIRDRLREHPTPEQLIASGDFSEPIPQGVVLDAMMLLAHLREAREASDLTLSSLAKRTGIDKPALSRLETGRQNNPTLHTILRYVHGLGMRIAWSIVNDSEGRSLEIPFAVNSAIRISNGREQKESKKRPPKRSRNGSRQ